MKQESKINEIINEQKLTLNILRYPILYNKFKDSIDNFIKKETLFNQT